MGCKTDALACHPHLTRVRVAAPPGIVGQWLAFEDMLKSGKTKSIAVSNFSPQQLDCIVSNKSMTVPAVNQMPYSGAPPPLAAAMFAATTSGVCVSLCALWDNSGLWLVDCCC